MRVTTVVSVERDERAQTVRATLKDDTGALSQIELDTGAAGALIAALISSGPPDRPFEQDKLPVIPVMAFDIRISAEIQPVLIVQMSKGGYPLALAFDWQQLPTLALGVERLRERTPDKGKAN